MTDRGQVYIVRGYAGEASDRSEWLVAAFTQEERAQLFAEVCRRKARDAYAALREARRAVLMRPQPPRREELMTWPEEQEFRFLEDPAAQIAEYTDYGIEVVSLDPEAPDA